MFSAPREEENQQNDPIWGGKSRMKNDDWQLYVLCSLKEEIDRIPLHGVENLHPKLLNSKAMCGCVSNNASNT
jgi:hypothetical protein